jgi:hypothetical protein
MTTGAGWIGKAAVCWLLVMGLAIPALADAAADRRIAELEKQVAELKAALEALRGAHGDADEAVAPERLAEIERRLEVIAQELERLQLGEAAAQADESQYGLGLAASKIYRTEKGLSIGGYGEALYQNFDSERDDGNASGRTDQADFLRAVLYFGYKFNDRFLFNSEIEFEHASTGSNGEVSAEFAYLDYLWKPEVNVRAGLLLVPMGFVNELHEPVVFLGAARPTVERVIIPSTWRENGLGLFGDLGPFAYRTYLVNGFDATGFSAGGLRGGRQSGSQAAAEDLAWVGRLDYTGTPGFLAGLSFYTGDSGQNLEDAGGGGIGVGTTLLEGHLEWKWRGLEVRLLGVQAELDDVAELNQVLGLTGNRSVGEELEGYYLQVGYDVLAGRSGERALIPFARLEQFDTQAKVPVGFSRNPANDQEILTLGVAYKPIERLIFKADYQDFDNEAGTGVDQFNLALGYVF